MTSIHHSKIDELLEGYAKNPSNSNKFRMRLFALLEELGIEITYGEEAK